MAIANSSCIRLLLCTYKSNTVCERTLWRVQLGVSPPNLGSGKEEPYRIVANFRFKVKQETVFS